MADGWTDGTSLLHISAYPSTTAEETVTVGMESEFKCGRNFRADIDVLRRPHRLHTVHRCGLLLQLSLMVWSLCLSAPGWTVQKWLNGVRADLCRYMQTCIKSLHSKGHFCGDEKMTVRRFAKLLRAFVVFSVLFIFLSVHGVGCPSTFRCALNIPYCIISYCLHIYMFTSSFLQQ